MSIERTITIDNITPEELATVFCNWPSDEQAEFFSAMHIISMGSWCQEAYAIAQEIDQEGLEVITKLAEHVLGYDDMLAALRGVLLFIEDERRWANDSDLGKWIKQCDRIEAIIARADGR